MITKFKITLLSFLIHLGASFLSTAQPIITDNGVYDDFSTSNEYTLGNTTRGIYWWNTDGVNSFTRDVANNQLRVHATQAEYQYVPFGVGFGTTDGQPNTIDLSQNGKWSFDITNYGTEDLFIRVACQDNQQRLMDCTTIPNPNNLVFDRLEVWAYQVQILVPVGKTVTFKAGTPNGAGKGYLNNCDFTRGAWGYYGTWDPSTQTHIGAEVRYTCDMTKIQGISITPMNAAKNTTDYHALALTNGIFGISNFKVGSTSIALDLSDDKATQGVSIFPNPAKNSV
ncbi:MAG: hypothetical protein K2Q22_13120, partial [Cytophagales bacterium]|nr:hypothetical protein [Cytophagales bacterium]